MKKNENALQNAENSAVKAQNNAQKSLERHAKYTAFKQRSENWDRIFATAHPFLLSFCYIILFGAGIYLSRDLFLEIANSSSFWWIPMTFLMIVAWKTGDMLRSIHSEHYYWDLYELTILNPNKPIQEIEEGLQKEMTKNKITGWIFFVIMTLIVAFCSYYRRVILLGEELNITDVLPIAEYITAVFSAVHVGYTIKRLFLHFKIKFEKKRFEKEKKACQYHTHNAAFYIKEAEKNGENTEILSLDLRETLYRHSFGSSLSDKYGKVDPKISKVSQNGTRIFETTEDAEFQILE